MHRRLGLATAVAAAVATVVTSGVAPPAQAATAPSAPRRATATQSVGIVDIVASLADGGWAAGTGMVVTPFGDVLTNHHVIAGALSLTVTVASTGRVYTATVLGYDRSQDVALLHLTGAVGLRTVSISRAGVVPRQSVVGVGNAGGVGGRPIAAAGRVVGAGRTIVAVDAGSGASERLTGLIEASARIAPGDSGGPLENAAGAVVGMDTAGAPSGFGPGYAIPILRAMSIVSAIRAGHATRTIHVGASALLGVAVSIAGSPLVLAVTAGTAADRAGLAPGDVITSVAGHRVASAAALSAVMQTLRAGSVVSVTWLDPAGVGRAADVTMTAGPTA